MENEKNPFVTEFDKIVEDIRDLFATKNNGYNTNSNPLLNFSVGGRLLTGREDLFGCFEALKAYMTKHVANVYSHNILAPKLEESMKDIATYMIIGIIMSRLAQGTFSLEENEPLPATESVEEVKAGEENEA